ncbi:MAG TPA: hypothetical protein VL914_00875 [Vicinamibacterales bacterium]|jgi:hypothetical protein|nr:hypothetical protein [Vicinamibacterales bacterium]
MDSNWQVIETPHFILNVRPGSFAEQNAARLGEVLEDQYAFALSALDIRYAGRISLFLYASAADAGENNDRSGTAYPETGAVRAIVTPPLETTFGLLSHESNHVIEHNALGPPATSFINEGLASAIMSERFHPGGKSFLYPWTARNAAQIPDLSSLVDDGTWGDYNSQVAYNASASFLAYILDQGGPARLKQLQSLRSSEFEARFQQIYGRSLDEAERDWRAFCAAYRP